MGDVKTLGVQRIEGLYRSYHHQLLGFFVRKGLDEGTAEDLSQEVFLRLLRSGKEIDGDGYARNLVYRVAQNLLIDHFRKNNGTVKVRLWPDEENPNAYGGDHMCHGYRVLDPEECCLSSEVSHEVRKAVSKLPRHYARALIMREYQGMSYREIASDLGLTEKAVESLLHRAKSQLKKELVGAREGGWWAALAVYLAKLKRKLLSVGESVSRCFRWGSITHISGAAGAGNAICNSMAICLLVCAVVGSGFLFVARNEGGHVGEARETLPASVLNRESELTAEEARFGEESYDNRKAVEANDRVVALPSPPLEDVRFPWRDVVMGGGEVLRALVRGGGNLLGTLLGTAEVMRVYLLGISAKTVAALGLPEERLLCYLAPADIPWTELKGLTSDAVGTAMDVTCAAEGTVLEIGSRTEASLEALSTDVEAEGLEPRSETPAEAALVNTLDVLSGSLVGVEETGACALGAFLSNN